MNDPLDDRIMLLIEQGSTIREMSADVGKSLDAVHGRIQDLLGNGYLIKVREDGQARPYKLSAAGDAYLYNNGLKPVKLFDTWE